MTLMTSRISDTENYGIGQYNTGINTADIYGGIPVFGIPVLEALLAMSHLHQSDCMYLECVLLLSIHCIF